VDVTALQNSHPVHVLKREGVLLAHALDEGGWYTACGMPADGGVQATYAQVHVWLDHAMCAQCFPKAHWP
jgi:hypothetical protein